MSLLHNCQLEVVSSESVRLITDNDLGKNILLRKTSGLFHFEIFNVIRLHDFINI